MENEKRKINQADNRTREEFSVFRSAYIVENICAACGAQAVRENAKFCRVCGKLLREEYQPLDRLRASYSLQQRGGGDWFSGFTKKRKTAETETENLFDENKNSASETAKALVVYSLVPYLGILFCPFALLSGGVGIFTAYRKPFLGGARTSAYSVILGFLIFAVQIFLWWLLYIIPELGRNF